MTVAAGMRLGPYEILSSIGAGGMGEVWRARDTRLNRDVAIKILPVELAQSAQLHARFDREAKAISSLNHPNICTLHDVGTEGTTSYLVMEYIEGETLGDRIRKGPLPIADVLRFGQQIASALDSAHRKGITHRDLKPNNIMLTRSGAKLLDFGLASVNAARRGTIDAATNVMTAERPLTAEGTIVGTFHYMAPEQLEGLEVDARTDIFALGAVLYEMATGRRAFEGTSKTTLIAAIVASQPEPIASLRPMSPPALDYIVRKCLEKNPEDRWQSAQDVAGQLQWISEVSASTSGAAAEVPRRWEWRRAALPLFVVLAILAGVATGRWSAPRDSLLPATESRVVRSRIALAPGIRLAGWGGPTVAISPDGRHVAYVGHDGTIQRLYLRRLDRDEAIAVPGSESAEGPFFSPDSRHVAFAVSVSGMAVDLPPEIRRVSVEGGLPQSVVAVTDFFGGTWASDGFIYYVGQSAGGLWKVRAEGGEPKLLTSDKLDVGFPSVLPDGKAVLATVGTPQSAERLAIIDTASGAITELPLEGFSPVYLPTGHLAYSGRDRRFMVVPFDLKSRAARGRGAVILEDVAVTGPRTPVVAVSNDGTLVYAQGFVTGSNRELSRIVRIGADGKEGVALPFAADTYSRRSISVSPDATRLVTATADGKIWIGDLRRGTRLPLPQPESMTRVAPLWSPDGKSVVFTGVGAGLDSLHLFIQAADGSSAARQISTAFERPFEAWPTSWLDDETLLFTHFSQRAPAAATVSIASEGPQPNPLLSQPDVWHTRARVSPDRRWVVYEARERNRSGIFVRRLDLSGGPIVVSMDGAEPKWSPDGSEVFFISGDRVMASRFRVGDEVHFDDPREVFRREGLKIYDPIPGTTDFVAIAEEPGSGVQTSLSVVQNWFREIEPE
jgi:eukaryotic-like serine/threonine-protein kinase